MKYLSFTNLQNSLSYKDPPVSNILLFTKSLADCNSCYMAQTKRSLKTRKNKEHVSKTRIILMNKMSPPNTLLIPNVLLIGKMQVL